MSWWEAFRFRWRVWRAACIQRRRKRLWVKGKITAEQATAGFRLETNPNCRHCYGRGWIGINRDTGEAVPCRCAKAVKE